MYGYVTKLYRPPKNIQSYGRMENQEIRNPEPERETEMEPEPESEMEPGTEQQQVGNTETSSAMKSFSIYNQKSLKHNIGVAWRTMVEI